MSHFCVYVLNPEKPETSEETKNLVARKLAFYDENLEVPEYPKSCYCVGYAARAEVREEVERQLGPMDRVREKYWSDIKAACEMEAPSNSDREATKLYREAMDRAEANIHPTWEERIQPRADLAKKLEEAHPRIKEADPECEECKGSGTYGSTRNPNSKWDWWVIGGRWNGHLLPDYDPTKDPRNLEVCWLCHGTGKRNDALGQQTREQDPSYTCNGCDGDGKSVVFPSKYVSPPEGGNVASVSDILANIKKGHDLLPFAFVLPTGEWVERGSMGWWAIVTDAKSDWKEIAQNVLEKYQDHWAIVVDCHI